MKILLIVVLAYLGVIYLVCGLLALGKKLDGGMSWGQCTSTVLLAPLFVAILILLSPVKVFKGFLKEIAMRKNEKK